MRWTISRSREVSGSGGWVAALCRLENSREPEDVQRVLGGLIEWLRAP